MKYSQDIYRKAKEELSRRKRSAELVKLRREEYVRSNLPEYDRLDAVIKGSYLELIKLIASHSPNARAMAENTSKNNLEAQKQLEEMVCDLTGERDFLKAPYTCKLCGDTGYRNGERCVCMERLLKKYAVEELNSSSNIVLHDFDEFKLDFYDAEESRKRMGVILQRVKSYCDRFPDGCGSLVFMGKTGLGKTLLSSCVAKAAAEKGAGVAFGSAPDLLRKIENEHFGRADGCTLDTLINADLLIIDDLGSEFDSAFFETTIYNIINGRLNLKKPTVLSTNYIGKELLSKYNERIVSRILGEFEPKIFVGSDIRQKKSALVKKLHQ